MDHNNVGKKTDQAIVNIKVDLKFKMKFQETVMETLRQLANQTADMEKEVKREHGGRNDKYTDKPMEHGGIGDVSILWTKKMRIVTEDFTFLLPNISMAAGSNTPYWESEGCQYQLHENGRPVINLKIIASEIAPQMKMLSSSLEGTRVRQEDPESPKRTERGSGKNGSTVLVCNCYNQTIAIGKES